MTLEQSPISLEAQTLYYQLYTVIERMYASVQPKERLIIGAIDNLHKEETQTLMVLCHFIVSYCHITPVVSYQLQ